MFKFGVKGRKGDDGAAGAKGDDGAQGIQGIQGEQGESGSGFTSMFRVERDAVQLIQPSTLTKVEFNTKTHDVETEFDIVTNHRFVAATTGIYKLGVVVGIGGCAAQKKMYAEILLNGETIISKQELSASVSSNLTATPPTEYPLSAGDYVEVWVWQNNTAAKNTLTYGSCQFFGHRIA